MVRNNFHLAFVPAETLATAQLNVLERTLPFCASLARSYRRRVSEDALAPVRRCASQPPPHLHRFAILRFCDFVNLYSRPFGGAVSCGFMLCIELYVQALWQASTRMCAALW